MQLRLPDGTIVTSAQEHVHALLSSVLGRDVILTTTRPASPSVEVERLDALDPAETIADIDAFMMPGRFADYAAGHLYTGRAEQYYRPEKPQP